MATPLDHLLKSIFYLPCSIVISYLMARMLQVRRPRLYMLCVNVTQILCYALYAIVLVQFSWGKSVNSYMQLGFYIVFCLFFGRMSLMRRVFAFSLTLLNITLSEIFSLTFFSKFDLIIDMNQVMYASRNVPLYACYQAGNLVISTILTVVILWLWDKLILKTEKKILWYYVLYVLTQGLIFCACTLYISAAGLSSVRYLIMTGLSVFCLVADVFLFRSMNQLTEKAVAEERAAWSENLLLQQEGYYAQILADTEDASRIRHDIRNQIQTVYALISRGETEIAQEQLDVLRERLDSKESYCENKVVNALLTVKAARFAQEHIPYHWDCSIPEDTPFDGVELCSLFSNILDNAFHATAPDETEGRFVKLTAGIRQNWFIVSCVNSIAPDSKSSRHKGQNLGLHILKDLAQRHNGEMKTEKTETTFKITLWLQLSPETE